MHHSFVNGDTKCGREIRNSPSAFVTLKCGNSSVVADVFFRQLIKVKGYHTRTDFFCDDAERTGNHERRLAHQFNFLPVLKVYHFEPNSFLKKEVSFLR